MRSKVLVFSVLIILMAQPASAMRVLLVCAAPIVTLVGAVAAGIVSASQNEQSQAQEVNLDENSEENTEAVQPEDIGY